MTEQERPSLTLDTFKKRAIELFDKYSTDIDQNGVVHPNSISRSCDRAVVEIMDEYKIEPMDFYAQIIAPDSPFKPKDIFEQYETKEERDNFVKRRISMITSRNIHLHEQNLVEIQRERLHNFRAGMPPLV